MKNVYNGETWIEFLASGFGLTCIWLLPTIWRSELSGREIYTLILSLSAYTVNKLILKEKIQTEQNYAL